jgi:hypothetical protein
MTESGVNSLLRLVGRNRFLPVVVIERPIGDVLKLDPDLKMPPSAFWQER